MGAYRALEKQVRDAADKLKAQEERWKLQGDRALEALQWSVFLSDEPRMKRVCEVVKKNAGLESAEVKRALTAIFNDSSRAPGNIRAIAGECLLQTDWRGARGEMIFAATPPREETIYLPPIPALIEILTNTNKNLQDTGFATAFTAGRHIRHAATVRDVFSAIADEKGFSRAVRDRAVASQNALRTEQEKNLETMVRQMETSAYQKRPQALNV